MSPRPLSKVRTSFVTVERSGQLGNQLGLKRDTSGEPSMTKRRTSFSIDEEEHPQTTAERKQSIATEMLARKQSAVIEETIPEVAVMTPQTTPAIEENNPLGVPNGKDRKKETPKPPKIEEKKPTNGPLNSQPNGTTQPTTSKVVDKPAATKTATKPAPISIAKTTAQSKASPKKSPLPKTPTTPKHSRTKDTATMTPERKLGPEKKPEKKASRSTLAAPNHTTRPASRPPTTHAHGSVPKTRIPASPPQTGFHKPRPKSPTKPVKLPASLTAHTASSGSKTASTVPPQSRQSLSRASGNIQSSVTRSPSRATVTSKTGPTRNPSTLKSATNRPSLGPPPKDLKKQPSRQSLSQTTAPADEGFLARMMRPTTSSASKTAEKTPATPPKVSQSVKRPATRDGPAKGSGSPVHKIHKEPTTKNVVKPVAKAAEPAKVKEASKATTLEKIVKEEKPVDTPADAPAENTEEINDIVAEESAKEELVDDEAAKEGLAHEEKPIVPEEAPVPAGDVEVPEATKEEPVAKKAEEVEVPEAPKGVPVITEEPVTEPEAIEEPTKTEEPIITAEAPKDDTPEVVQEAEHEAEEEDPEDAKAREEIAKINAEFARVALEEEAESKS